MVFGSSFEKALGAFFRREDPGAALFTEWGAYRDAALEYRKGETWDRLVHQGIQMLERFAQDDRIRIDDPQNNLQIKIMQPLPGGSEFLAYVDAIGEIDGIRCVIDWKTTTTRYCENPGRFVVARSAINLLFLAYWDFGSGLCGLRSQTPSRNPIFEGHYFRSTAQGVRSIGRDYRQPD
jgi:hypothetical protein